jgi:hypothetical protein
MDGRYSLHMCSSCGSVGGDGAGECKLGCVFAARPDVVPQPPPTPQPPPSPPPAPLCGVFPFDSPGGKPGTSCSVGADLNFSTVFSHGAVLQMAPSRAAVYGYVGTNANSTTSGYSNVSVTVVVADQQHQEPQEEGQEFSNTRRVGKAAAAATSYTVQAVVNATTGAWKALLPPTTAGGAYTLEASCAGGGCTGSPVALRNVTFGSVWCVECIFVVAAMHSSVGERAVLLFFRVLSVFCAFCCTVIASQTVDRSGFDLMLLMRKMTMTTTTTTMMIDDLDRDHDHDEDDEMMIRMMTMMMMMR